MRLISQDSIHDMPYEKTIISAINTRLFGEYDSCCRVLGEFSTTEKAVNELKKIRTAYASGRMIYKIGE